MADAADVWGYHVAGPFYLGALAVAPTTDKFGTLLNVGHIGYLYWDTAVSKIYLWNGVAWIDPAYTVFDTAGADIAAGTTTDIGAATGNFVTVTGNATISNLGIATKGVRRKVLFTGTPILDGTTGTIVLPLARSFGSIYKVITGDIIDFISLGSGDWQACDFMERSGIWTPEIWDTNKGSPSWLPTYGTREAYYTRVWDVVNVWGKVALTAIGTLTAGDPAYLGNLPFSAAGLVGSPGAVNFNRAAGLNLSAGFSIAGSVKFGQYYAELYARDVSTAGDTALTCGELVTAATVLEFQGKYITDGYT